ncbi:MAG: DUF1905 domain-containing protein [Sediminibacterium sp.]|nr:DUF1905 domain-containing protein [Sediminibacterium sp.]
MRPLIKNKKLELKYVPGKGAWTYHLEIPGTKDIKGKWGDMKVSGNIDGYRIEKRNLAPIRGADKIISINDTIRKAIGKSGGDMVSVTLYLDSYKQKINKKDIVAAFRDAGVLPSFRSQPKEKQTEIIQQILSGETENKQIQQITKYIDLLS